MADSRNEGAREGSPRRVARTELLRQRSNAGVAVLTFQEIVAQGPTDIPDTAVMNAALAGILPVDAVAADSATESAAVAAAAAEKKEQGGGLLGWALQPLWMGIDTLKWAGQTVNDRAVAPVVRYASPLGWASYLFDVVKNLTPQRARDLARIFGNATFNAVGLTQTPAGHHMRAAALKSVDTFASMISAPAGRQLVIDGAAGFVKVAEALDTPETKDAVQQIAVLTARFFDLLASHESKAFLQTAADAACRFVELANSPEATVMAAEFTANVVHALEAEHAQHHGIPLPAAADTAAADAAGSDKKGAASSSSASSSRDSSSDKSSLQQQQQQQQRARSSTGDSSSSNSSKSGVPAEVIDYETTICEKFTVPSGTVVAVTAATTNKVSSSSSSSSVKSPQRAAVSQAELNANSNELLESAPEAERGLTVEQLKQLQKQQLQQQQQQDAKQKAADSDSTKSSTAGATASTAAGAAAATGTKLPRYTREHFESVLTKRTKTLAEQAPAPTEASIEAALAAAEQRVGRQLTAAAETHAQAAQDEVTSLVQAAAILFGVLLWSLLGLYGLKQALFRGSSGSLAHDEL